MIDSNVIEPLEENRNWGLEQISYHMPAHFKVRMFKILSVEETTPTTDFSKLIANSNLTKLESEFFTNEVPEDLLVSVKSGHKFPILLEITVLDQNNDTMITVNDEVVDFSLELADPVSDTTTKAISFSDSF